MATIAPKPMTSKTRYFVIVSLLVMVVGLGTGLVAYRAGFPAAAFFSGAVPDELRYMPSSASVVAYFVVTLLLDGIRPRKEKR